MKKGQIEIQINWIFILIVGVIILLFFLMITNKQQDQATVTGANDLIQNIDTVFTTISQQANSVQKFNIPNVDIKFTCEPGLSQYYIQGVGPKPTSYDVIFTQNNLKGNNIITWTKSWDIPYEAAIFTYMSNDKTLYIFVNTSTTNDEYTVRLHREMPGVFSKTYVHETDIDTLRTSGYDKYVFIGHTNDLNTIRAHVNNFAHNANSVIRTIDTANGFDYGTITFARSIGTPETRSYYQRNAIWGAIFTEDEETYDCTMTKALFKAKVISKVLRYRAEAIKNELVYSNCYSYFSTLDADYDAIIAATETYDALALQTYKEGLEQKASDSLRGYTCPYLY